LPGARAHTLLMRHGQLSVNGTPVSSPSAFILPDGVADQPQVLFTWQHQIETHGSRFGPPVASPSLHEWEPLIVPSGTLFTWIR